jgi:hypothetical protein
MEGRLQPRSQIIDKGESDKDANVLAYSGTELMTVVNPFYDTGSRTKELPMDKAIYKESSKGLSSN